MVSFRWKEQYRIILFAKYSILLVFCPPFILSINYVKVKAEILDYFPPARPASLGEAGEADQPLADIILFLSRHFIFYSWWAGSRFSGDII